MSLPINPEQFLTDHNIAFKRHEHPAVYTCEEADKYCKDIPGLACKNLFLRSKKGRRHLLIVMPSAKRADLKKIATLVQEPKVSFGKPEDMMELLGLEPGSVSPFGILNDTNKKVELYIDQEVYDANIVSFHPNKNTATLELNQAMFHKFLKTVEHETNIITM